MSQNNYTYDKRLGWENTERKEPVVKDKAGVAFMTHDGTILVVPDQWQGELDGMPLRQIAPGTVVKTFKGHLSLIA